MARRRRGPEGSILDGDAPRIGAGDEASRDGSAARASKWLVRNPSSPSGERHPLPSHAAERGGLPWGAQLRRGELYRVRHPSGDTKRSRVVVVVSRPAHLASRFSTAICAPVYSQRGGLSTEVEVGPAEGLKHPSAILCDVLTSFPRSQLTDYVGTLGPTKLAALRVALRIAVDAE